MTANLHATCVALGNKGVLLLGQSGSGKSDLALRLIDDGAKLVADDRVEIRADGKKLVASAPKKIKGKIELYGVGIYSLPVKDKAELALAVSLVAREALERMPEESFFDCEGKTLPLLFLHAFDISTPIKIRMKLEKK